MPNLLLTMWDTIKSSNIGILVAAGLGMFAIIGGLSMLSYHYTLSGIKSRTVGDGQHGTARWATDRILSQRSTKNLFVAFEIFLVSIFRLVEKADVHCNLERDLGVRYFMADSFQPLPVLCHKG